MGDLELLLLVLLTGVIFISVLSLCPPRDWFAQGRRAQRGNTQGLFGCDYWPIKEKDGKYYNIDTGEEVQMYSWSEFCEKYGK